jgi:mono/diheme cytochrome c family protein
MLLGGIVTLVTACTPTGSYPIDFFYEMHYQPSQRRLEPKRIPPPEGSVPITGGTPSYTWDQVTNMTSPVPRNAQTLARGETLFTVNCAMCHGAKADGQSFIATRFNAAHFYPPVDLHSQRVQSRTDGQLYWIVTNGLGNMPTFRNLLTDDDRWAMVNYIRNLQGQ